MKKVIILGSAAKGGNTKKMISELVKISPCDVVDLNNYTISYFDYEHQNRADDFIILMERIINNYQAIIFATPVYWYAMSGIMKVFFDRFTDLITIEKDLGRQLRGKHMAVITSSSGDHLGEAFWLPFQHTAKYLGMEYITNLHTESNNLNIENLEYFMNTIDKTA